MFWSMLLVTTEKLVEVQTTLQEEMTTESVQEETTNQALDTTLKPGEHSRDASSL